MKTNIIAFVVFLLYSVTAYTQREYQEFLDLSYMSEEKVVVDSLQSLNLVIPKETKKPPLLLWIGGGAWSFVNRGVEMTSVESWLKTGSLWRL